MWTFSDIQRTAHTSQRRIGNERNIALEEHMSLSKETGIPSLPSEHRSSSGAVLASGRDAKHEARRARQNHADTHQRPDHPQ